MEVQQTRYIDRNSTTSILRAKGPRPSLFRYLLHWHMSIPPSFVVEEYKLVLSDQKVLAIPQHPYNNNMESHMAVKGNIRISVPVPIKYQWS